MIKKIVQLLSEQQCKQGIRVAFSVLARAILDFAGVAALIPVLLVVTKQDAGQSNMTTLYGAVMLFVILKNGVIALLARLQSSYQLNIYRELGGCSSITTIADCSS